MELLTNFDISLTSFLGGAKDVISKSNIGDLQLRSWKSRAQQNYRAAKKNPEVRKSENLFE